MGELPTFELEFKKEKCSKCGAKGDSRYMIAACHTKLDHMHSQPLASKHPGNKVYHHPGKLKAFEKATGLKRHIGQKTWKHSGVLTKYHPGEKEKTFVSRIARIGDYFTEEQTRSRWYWYGCCNTYVKNAGNGCTSKWTCCDKKEGIEQCNKKENRTWSCCGKRWHAEGCEEITKIEKLYSCCKRGDGSDGCTYIYHDCCRKKKNCYYYWPCCQTDANDTGCKKRCVNCKLDWGTGPGCVQVGNSY